MVASSASPDYYEENVVTPYSIAPSPSTSLQECAYGTVARASVVRHKHRGKSAGYGFVEMGSGEQALRAVVALEGALLEGNCLRLYVTPYVSTELPALPTRQEETNQ